MSGSRYNFKGTDIELPLIYSGGFHNYNYSMELDKHVHQIGSEITYVMKGFAEWQLDSGTKLEQSGGTLAIVPQNIRHRGAEGIISPCWLFWYVIDLRNQETARQNTPFSSSEMKLIFDSFSVKSGRVIPAVKGLDKHFLRLLELLKQGTENPWYVAEIRMNLCQIVLDTIKSLAESEVLRDDSLAMRAREYMQKNITNNISVDNIAAACGLSESQFARRFKQAAGITPADCLQRIRIEEACSLLREKNNNITEVAFKLGFSSSQYFSTVFKRYIGMTPYHFQKNR
jgi:AraC-like DNA-binding protein